MAKATKRTSVDENSMMLYLLVVVIFSCIDATAGQCGFRLNGNCVCGIGFSGPDSQNMDGTGSGVCSTVTCMNGGICSGANDTCLCPAGFYGADCSITTTATSPATLSMMPNVYTIPESVGTFDIFIQRHGTLLDSLTFELTVTEGSATMQDDFDFSQPVTLTFQPGQFTTRFQFNIIDDTNIEEHEYFRVAIDKGSIPSDSLVEGDGEARVYIWDDDVDFAVCPANISNVVTEYPTCIDLPSLTQLSQMHVNSTNVAGVSSLLARVTDNIQVISNEDFELIAGTLENIVNVGDSSMEVTNSVVNVISNIMESSGRTNATFDDNASTNIISSLETQASLALNNVNNTTEITVIKPNVVVSGVVLDNESTLIGGIGFGIQTMIKDGFGNNSTKTYREREAILEDNPDAYIYVPQLPNATDSNQATFLFIAYRNDFLFPTTNGVKDNYSVGGFIISATVEGTNDTNIVQFDDPVVFESAAETNETGDSEASLEQRNSCSRQPETLEPRCVFWDFKLSNGSGGWSTDGCRYMGDNDGRTVCHCDHLTNFAVLVYHGETPVSSRALDIFSRVGCALSVASLVVTVGTFLIFKTLRNEFRIIHLQLSTALILLYVTFLAGIDRTCHRVSCSIVAAVLHYAILASVAWMMVEARFLYIKLVTIFDHPSENFVIKYSVAAWGVPLVIVIVSVSVSFGLDLRHYQNPYYCFIMPGPVVYYALLLPIGLALTYNIVTFILIVRNVTRQRGGQARKAADHKALVTRFRSIISISSVMGLAWIFGFLAIDEATLVFQILFCICNSLQGVLIFVLFCVAQADVRAVVRNSCVRMFPCLDRRQHNTNGGASGRVQVQSASSSAYGPSSNLPSAGKLSSNEGFEMTDP